MGIVLTFEYDPNYFLILPGTSCGIVWLIWKEIAAHYTLIRPESGLRVILRQSLR